ncbi:MAG: ATP-binding protein [Halopseudomonas sp.]
MRFSLRKKLLLVLPFLGLLPWLGLRYFDAINTVVDQSQLQAARLVAEAVAGNIHGAELPPLLPRPASKHAAVPVYGLKQPLTLDGFFSDWPEHHPASSFDRIQLRAAQWREQVYLAIDVADSSRYYRQPFQGGYDYSESTPQALDHDYLELSFDGGNSRYRLTAEGPGYFLAQPLGRDDHSVPVMIEAVWWELADRYQLELALPLALLGDSGELQLRMHDYSPQGIQEQQHSVRLQRLRPELQRLLAHYSQVEQQLLVQDGQDDIVAISEGLGPRSSGRLQRFVGSGQDSLIEDGWSTVRVPIQPGDPASGHVVVQVVSDAVSQVQRKTLFDLGWQTLAVLLLVIAGLLLFASRLAYRIKRMGAELKAQYDSQGRLSRQHPFSGLTASDEVGELSRDMDEVLDRLERYTQFLQRVPKTLRHELSNPLNTISTSLELLSESPDSSQQQRLIASAERGISKLEKTIESITEAVSLEDALKHEATAQIDLNALLQSYCERCQMSSPNHRFELLLPTQTLQIQGSDLRLEQLLDKLIDNAVGFSPLDSPIVISLSGGDGIELTVSNRGEAIDSARAEHLFELFSGDRNDGSGNHLGLGLYVVKLIAEAHGATAGISSEADRVVVAIRWD